MALEERLTRFRDSNPVDIIEHVALSNEWTFERSGDDDISVMLSGLWTDYSVSFSWDDEYEFLHVVCAFEMKIPENRHFEAVRLLSLVNEQMLLGHFDLWLRDGSVIFRHALPLVGGVDATESQVECMLRTAFTCCERYYQAFQFVVWAGRSASDALDSVLFDTVGEA